MRRRRDRRRPRVWRFAVAGAALLAGGWWLLAGPSNGVDTEWATVEREDLVLAVDLEGTLEAVDSSSLGPPNVARIWNFKISFMAPEGSEVAAGEPVLAFDTSELERTLQEKIAERDAAQQEIDKLRAELTLEEKENRLRLSEARAKRRKALLQVEVPGELASSFELEKYRLDLELAEREVAYLESKLSAARRAGEAHLESLVSQRDRAADRVEEIEEAIERMTVKAPRDGTVIYLTNWRDEKKKVGDQCWRSERVIEIPDLSRMMARGVVDEADSSRLSLGQRVDLRLDASPDRTFAGEVSYIWETVQRKSWRDPQKVVRLDIELDETDPRQMRPGMRFRGAIETGRVADALVVPLDCVFVRRDGAVAYRRTLRGYEEVALTLGARNGDEVEVVEGLREGDRIARTDPAASGDRT